MTRKLRLVCIASGSGTDFESIAAAWKAGGMPEISEVVLISTKEGAGCLEKAAALGIKSRVVTPMADDKEKFLLDDDLVKAYIALGGAHLTFLVGCIVKVPYTGHPLCNIHPADPHEHGGKGMYGLEVHIHVLRQIIDQIKRGWKKAQDRFFTYPTIHEAAPEFDQGQILLQAHVEIPGHIISELMQGTLTVEEAAKALQAQVLPYEWMMLPCAVRLAARKILEAK